MSKGKAIVLAVFTAWPFLYILLFMCVIFGLMMSDFSGGHRAEPPFIIWIIPLLHFFTMLEMLL